MENTIPFFVSDHSIGESILTVDDESEINTNKPVSIVAISETYALPVTYVVERGMSSYWKLYSAFAKRPKSKLAFGVKIDICANPTAEEKTDVSSLIIFLKNTQGYYDMIKMYSAASLRNKSKTPLLSWEMLTEFMTPNLTVVVPFYSGFLARNTLKLNCSILPNFGTIQPIFAIEGHDIPFDTVIESITQSYCKKHNYQTLNTHHIYYYRSSHVSAHQAFLCIGRRTHLEKPNLESYCSDQFSFESYLQRGGEVLK